MSQKVMSIESVELHELVEVELQKIFNALCLLELHWINTLRCIIRTFTVAKNNNVKITDVPNVLLTVKIKANELPGLSEL